MKRIQTPDSGLQTNAGFSLVEVIIAMSVFLIVMLGISSVLVYTINFNAGNNTRTQALVILQQEMEQLRAAKFMPGATEAALAGGVHPATSVTKDGGGAFSVLKVIDDDPFTEGIQTAADPTIKEITVTVTLDRPTPGWQTALPATTVFRRARAHN